MNAYDVRAWGNRRLPARMEIIPAERPNQRTVMTVTKYEFDIAIDDSFFSQQNMQRVQ